MDLLIELPPAAKTNSQEGRVKNEGAVRPNENQLQDDYRVKKKEEKTFPDTNKEDTRDGETCGRARARELVYPAVMQSRAKEKFISL